MPAADNKIAYLIIGGGLAGAKAAEALRQEGAKGRVVLLSADADRPYHRPPLSKDFLRGETARDDVFVHPADWAAQHDVEVRLECTVEHLSVAEQTVTLAGGETLSFNSLLLATGASPRTLEIPGADLPGVHHLRSLRDSETIRGVAAGKQRAVLIGGGFIATELAASLRQVGLETTLVTRQAVLWEHLFGSAAAQAFQRTLTGHGVTVINGDEAARIEGNRRAERVITSGGRTLAADLIVAGVGVTPETKLARHTSVKVDSGIVVDQFLQTNQPGIYAAGDVARFFSPLYEAYMRVEHWDVAQQQGALAGKNMAREAAGEYQRREAFDQPPYFFSDLFDLSMEYLGHNQGWDDLVTRGDLDGREFTAFYLKGGRLVAGLFVNRNADVEPARSLIQRRLQVDDAARQQLGDAQADLEKVAAP